MNFLFLHRNIVKFKNQILSDFDNTEKHLSHVKSLSMKDIAVVKQSRAQSAF